MYDMAPFIENKNISLDFPFIHVPIQIFNIPVKFQKGSKVK